MQKLSIPVLCVLALTACESAQSDLGTLPPKPDDASAVNARDSAAVTDAAGMTFDAGADGKPSFCSGQNLCDTFESYAVGALKNGTSLGPWRTAVDAMNGAASIDTSKAYTGSHSLKVHVNAGSAGGSQLRTQSNLVFAPSSPKLYGKFRMYLEPGAGTSNHWTLFGGAGTVQPGVPIAGNHVTYLFSAFKDNSGKNQFGNVFYNDQTRQDCWHHSTQEIPSGRWACVGFSVDGPKIEYRVALDGQPVPSLSVNTTGDGCLNAAANAPWYGPSFDEFYVGALSFHPMSAALDLWIDDVVLDTSPVACE
jgi:hypothetical protein